MTRGDCAQQLAVGPIVRQLDYRAGIFACCTVHRRSDGRAPCVLCWYQRAFMFPLVFVLAVASYRSDTSVWRYALPLAAGGWLIAAFHSLQYLGIIPASLEPCGAGPSCTGADMTILGGFPIPVLSLVAFTTIAALLTLVSRRHNA